VERGPEPGIGSECLKAPEAPEKLMSRYFCPFYGITLARAGETHPRLIGIDSGDNKCGLMTSDDAPCTMEIAAREPSWEDCPRNPERSIPLVDDLRETLVKILHESAMAGTDSGNATIATLSRDGIRRTGKPI
jgi:hypothetical protein